MLHKVDPQLLAATTSGLRISKLYKQLGTRQVLQGINLDVDKGELITVLGPSGSGKTTLLRLICGFMRLDSGHITLGTRLVADGHGLHVPPEKRGIGYVAQEGALFPHLSVQDNVLFGLPRHIRNASRRHRASRAEALLDLVGLPTSYAPNRPSMLSGGEQQRVALARALAPQPTMVLLDEPFSGLDAGLRADLRDTVAAALKRVGATALLVTHDQDEALSMGDRVAVLQNGVLGQVAAPQALYRHPANCDIARFVGDAVIVSGVRMGKQVQCRFGLLPLAPAVNGSDVPDHGTVDVMIRPEQFRLCSKRAADPATDPACCARVIQLTFHGHDARVTLHAADGQSLIATVPGHNLPTPGDHVGLEVMGSVVAYAHC